MVQDERPEINSDTEEKLWEIFRVENDRRRARAKECADDLFALCETVAKALAMRDWLGFDDVAEEFLEEWGRLEGYIRRDAGGGDPEAVTP